MAINYLTNKFVMIFLYLLYAIKSIEETNLKFILNIKGNTHFLNYYYLTLFIGEKRQNQTYLIDTTSSVLTSPCSFCLSCGDHINDYFQIESNLSIIKPDSYECSSLPNIFINENSVNCNFFLDIENEQISGLYTYSLVSFESITTDENKERENYVNITNENEFMLPIGCSTKETGVFQSRISDGIVGLNNNKNSFVGKMYNMNLIKNDLFSICLDDEGGYLSLGEIDETYHVDQNISYINYNPKSELYELNISEINIGSYKIKIGNRNKTIIDTSSTISYFPTSIFNMLMTGLFYECNEKVRKCGNFKRVDGYGLCTEFDDLDDMDYTINNLWPNLLIEFNGYEFVWEPKNYYFNISSSFKYKACIGFEINENTKDTIILGTNFMHGYDLIFDRENYTIGFAEAECGRNMNKKLYLIEQKKKSKEKNNNNKEQDKNEENNDNENGKDDEKIKKYKDDINSDNDKNNNDDYNKEKLNDNGKDDNYIKYYYLLGIIFIVIIVIIIIMAINFFQNNNEQSGKNKYKEIFMNEEKETKSKVTQIIEMVEDTKKQ